MTRIRRYPIRAEQGNRSVLRQEMEGGDEVNDERTASCESGNCSVRLSWFFGLGQQNSRRPAWGEERLEKGGQL